MSDQQNTPTEADVEVVERNEVYTHDFLSVAETRVRYRQSDGEMSEAVLRLSAKHADAVGALVYDPRTDEVILVRQFRYPAYEHDRQERGAAAGAKGAWLLEIVAGLREGDQSAEETARREIHEEIGYEVSGALEPIGTFYTSPGALTEQITLFLAEVDSMAHGGGGGGLAEEGEDTELVSLPRAKALDMLAHGELPDAKTAIALQYLALRQQSAGGNSA